MSAVVSRDFPASPAMSTTWPSPVFALAQRRCRSSSSSRPTKAPGYALQGYTPEVL
jgi:hypothetical protein